MPPEIPAMCGAVTCGHEEPGKPCKRTGDETLWACQQPLGRCEIHKEFVTDEYGNRVALFRSKTVRVDDKEEA